MKGYHMSDQNHHRSVKFPDHNTRFHLHGPTYQETQAKEVRDQAKIKEIFNAIRQREPRKVAEAAVISTGGEMVDDGVPDDDIDPATLARIIHQRSGQGDLLSVVHF